MKSVNIESIEKNFDYILSNLGTETFIDWEKFSYSSASVVNLVDQLFKKLTIFREQQCRNFIQTMKKLKKLDLPDLISSVRNKKLPKQALKGILHNFKPGNGEEIQLIQPKQQLKQDANKEFQQYLNKNTSFSEQLRKVSDFLDEKIKQSGYVANIPVSSNMKTTIKFNISEQSAKKLLGRIKIEKIPGTKFIGLKTYSQIVGASYELAKQQYKRLTLDARIRQRQDMNNPSKYLADMTEYLLNTDGLILEAQKTLARQAGLTDSLIQQSEMVMIQRGLGNHVIVLQNQLRTKIKQSIKATQEISYQAAKEIIEFQVRMLHEKKDYFKRIFDGFEKTQQTIQMIPMLIVLILNDLAFQKYRCQQEDFMKNVTQQLLRNPDFSKIYHDMEIGIKTILEFTGMVDPETRRLSQQQQALAQGINPYQLMLSNSVFEITPTTNPIQLIKNSQIRQIKQLMSGNKNENM